MRPEKAEFRVELPEGWAHKKCAEPADDMRRFLAVFPEFGPLGSCRRVGPVIVAEQLGHEVTWRGDGYWVCSCWVEGRGEKNWRKHADWVVATV